MTRRRGEHHPQAKLSREQVIEIRKSVKGPSDLARQYGVSKALISLIKRGKLWADLPEATPTEPAQVAAPPVQIKNGPEPEAPLTKPARSLFPSAEDSIS